MTGMPAPFMYLHGSDVGCYVDPWAPPSSGLFWFEMPVGPIVPIVPFFADGGFTWPARKQPTKPIVIAHPAAWAERGAFNLARAYRPEVP